MPVLCRCLSSLTMSLWLSVEGSISPLGSLSDSTGAPEMTLKWTYFTCET